MAWTDTSEKELESIIVRALTSENGYEQGVNADYDQEFAIDTVRLFRFLQATQPKALEMLGVFQSAIKKRQFLQRLRNEITKRGIVDVLRKGIHAYPVDSLILFYLTPTEKNRKAEDFFQQNIFSVTRQLQYSKKNPKLALDLCIFINGLPVMTLELKNQFTGQCTEDAVEQYKRDRDPRELLFQFKRCMVHFAVDDATVKFCTKIDGQKSWFLPFNKGYRDGAGNPPNPSGTMTDYLWKDVFTKRKLAKIIEDYAQVVTEKDADTQKKTVKQIFPRYHQLDCVEKLIADVRANGIGKRYLIQHSAGSGKSNSIAWLAYQLIGLQEEGHPLIDSVLVVTDRVILDKQIRDNIKQFRQVTSTVAWADRAGNLRRAIEQGKRIIITTIEKFPFIVSEIGETGKDRRFAIIIDEAHSGQTGRNAAKMNLALSGEASMDEADNEDKINKLMEGRKLVTHASYFAFTATPKNKTLEMFGVPYLEDGKKKFRPFHEYTMKQAIEEGFILDVLKYYTPIQSYYRLMKTVSDDPLFDKKRAQKRLRAFVESDSYTIAQKAEMMVEHFLTQVIGRHKIGGQARAMVVTASINRCIEYYWAINTCLANHHSPYKTIIAFSGESNYQGHEPALTSANMNGFSDSEIPKKFKEDPYRILIVADMFQTGFDEPLLHTMYVDKVLYDIKAVQTLSRLNRCYPQKYDTFVLDFANSPEDIREAFSKYYKTTILSGESDPNKLYDLISILEEPQVYTEEDIDTVVNSYLSGADRQRLDPVLDVCSKAYQELDVDMQIQFKSAAKAFCRTYGFLGAILPYGNAEWERLSIFLHLLIPKLPAPKTDDLSEGITDVIDLNSYRLEAQETMQIRLADEDGEVDPVPTGNIGHLVDPDMEKTSVILKEFNDFFGNVDWNDKDNVKRQVMAFPEMVSKDESFQNAIKNSDAENARIECDRALNSVMMGNISDHLELFKQYQDNPEFRKWLSDMVFHQAYVVPKKKRVNTWNPPSAGLQVAESEDEDE